MRAGRVAPVAFGLLVVATFAAFFVAQRIKNTPSIIQQLRFNTYDKQGSSGVVFSPNGDGRRDRVRIGFMLKKADHVTLTILDADGDPVRTLVNDRRLRAYERLGLPGVAWDGRDDDGKELPDGRYRLRITLRDQGRSVISTRSIVKDTAPPSPRITSIGPEKTYGPELLPEPGGAPAEIHFGPALDRPQLLIFRTGPGDPRLVRTVKLTPGDRSWTWDGTTEQGRRVSPGTYVVVAQWRDEAGNIGSSVPLDRAGLPVLSGKRLPGRGGITVRYLSAQPPVEPIKARDPMAVFVDARRERYRWRLRRLGESTPRKSGGPKTRARVTLRAPGGKSGVYVFEVRTSDRATRVVIPVQARRERAGTASDPRGVLVVLPAITWQGRNPADDDGDGAPNVLDNSSGARLLRPMAGDGLPAGFAEHEAPVLQWLDRTGRRYDITTDAALAAGRGPRLTGHRGVLIPGDARWLPVNVRRNLRTFAREGGTIVSLGTDSLRRTVRLSDKARLTSPSRPMAADLFGARLRPLVTHPTDIEIFGEDTIGLFTGTDGLIPQVESWEATAAGREADPVASAVTADPPGRTVVLAVRFGTGLVIRPGFPSFGARLANDDPAITPLMARMWTLLSR